MLNLSEDVLEVVDLVHWGLPTIWNLSR
jgi:hypothetical protein